MSCDSHLDLSEVHQVLSQHCHLQGGNRSTPVDATQLLLSAGLDDWLEAGHTG
jgi:hypothetical protein